MPQKFPSSSQAQRNRRGSGRSQWGEQAPDEAMASDFGNPYPVMAGNASKGAGKQGRCWRCGEHGRNSNTRLVADGPDLQRRREENGWEFMQGLPPEHAAEQSGWTKFPRRAERL